VSYLVPPAHDAAHVAALRRLAAREGIALIVPTSDQDVRVVSRHAVASARACSCRAIR